MWLPRSWDEIRQKTPDSSMELRARAEDKRNHHENYWIAHNPGTAAKCRLPMSELAIFRMEMVRSAVNLKSEAPTNVGGRQRERAGGEVSLLFSAWRNLASNTYYRSSASPLTTMLQGL
jgi:hypothetical protein